MTFPMPWADYDALPGLSQSRLKPILISPAHYQQSLKAPRKETPALRFGSAADVAAFEPHQFAHRFVVAPDGIDRRTKAGKEAWAQFVEASAGKAILTADEHDRAWACGEAVRSSFAGRLLEGEKQAVIRWTDERTGLQCKGRADVITGGAIVDLKTCVSVDANSFGRDIAKYGYHFQGAFYRAGYHAMTGKWLDFVIVAVEKFPPHDVGAFILEGDALQKGNELVRLALDRYAACAKAGKWPGRYATTMPALLPAYALTYQDEDEQADDSEAIGY